MSGRALKAAQSPLHRGCELFLNMRAHIAPHGSTTALILSGLCTVCAFTPGNAGGNTASRPLYVKVCSVFNMDAKSSC